MATRRRCTASVDNELRCEAALRAFELLLLRETGVLPEFSAPR